MTSSAPVPDGASRVDLRLVPAAVTAWTVTSCGILWDGRAALAAAIGCCAVVAGVTWWRRTGSGDAAAGSTALWAVGAVALGFTAAVAIRSDEVRHHPITALDGATTEVVVTPSENPRPIAGGRLMLRGSLQSIGSRESSGLVVVFASAPDFGDLTAGRPARFRARVGKPLRRDLTVAVLSATGRPTLGDASPIQRVAQRIRQDFGTATRAVLPPDQAAMLPALVLGDTSAVTGRTVEDFRTAGLTHLTAVSGANVTIVCGAVLLSAALIGPRWATALAAAALAGFVVLVQPSPSVLRAAVMGAITLLAVVSHRRRKAIPALGASVIALMIGAPQLAVDIGFALSVVATAALVVIAPVWSRRLVGRGWPKSLADAVCVALAAQVVTAPLVAAISGRFSLVAVAANLAVAAVIAPITIIGTAAAALGSLWPAGAEFLIRFTGPEVWWLLAVAHRAAALPAASVAVPEGVPGFVTIAAATVAVVSGVALAARWRRRDAPLSADRDTIVG